ncbi:MAG: cytidylate kinase family protein [Oscillospiraceae bacterium]|nr:cytidylate kinase family protein [Oscillospiraceae bacterium]
MKLKNLFDGRTVRRTAVFIVGIIVSAFGVALASKSALGVTPLSLPAYVLAQAFTLTMGQFLILQHTVFLLIQLLLLRRQFRIRSLLQLPMAVIYGEVTDFALWCLSGIDTTAYTVRLALCAAGIVVTGAGVFLTVNARILVLAGEGLTLAIAKVAKKEFGKTKIAVDCGLLICGVTMSLVLLRKIVGIREGTVAAALLVGVVVQVLNTHRGWLDSFLSGGEEAEPEPSVAAPEKPHLVVTVAREFGPAGMQVVQQLSQMLNLPVYDNELTEMVIAESGLDAEFVRRNEERMSRGLLYYLHIPSYDFDNESANADDTLFAAQRRVITKLAGETDCIILGRTAGYILGHGRSYYHVLLHAKLDERIKTTMAEFGLKESAARSLVNRGDSERKLQWRHRTGRAWGLAKDYDLCVDITGCRPEDCAAIIAQAVKAHVYAA